MKHLFAFLAFAVLMNMPNGSDAYQYDGEETRKLIENMIRDLGGHDQVDANNGVTRRCAYGGFKRVTVSLSGTLSSYKALYNNCREPGSVRDGLYEIVVDGDQVVTSESERSMNGLLFDAAMEGNLEGVRKLIKGGADVNYTESIPTTAGGHIDEWSPLMSAVISGKPDLVKALVKAGAQINYLNSLAVNPLWLAANKGHLEIVRLLVSRGAYVNNSNYENVTPLMAAAMNGSGDVVRFLLKSRARVNAVNRDGESALTLALAKGYTEVARILIKSGADVNVSNRDGVTPLHIAVAEKNLEGVRMLLAAGAGKSARTMGGKSPLDVARERGFTEIAAALEP